MWLAMSSAFAMHACMQLLICGTPPGSSFCPSSNYNPALPVLKPSEQAPSARLCSNCAAPAPTQERCPGLGMQMQGASASAYLQARPWD